MYNEATAQRKKVGRAAPHHIQPVYGLGRVFGNAMAFIPVPQVAHVQIMGLDDGQQVINNLYFDVNAAPPISLLSQLALQVATWWVGNVIPVLSESYIFQRVVVSDLEIQNGLQVQFAQVTPGGVAAEQAPNNVAACISFRTGFRGRSFRGRNYVAGIPNSQIATNVIDPAFIGAIQDAYRMLLPGGGAISGIIAVWVVVSRFTSGGPRPTGVFAEVVDAVFTDNIVDSMRRRLPGRGA